jgi:hypothetical protein
MGATAAARSAQGMAALTLRFHGEYREMPGLRLNARQAARLFGVEADIASAVLDELRRTSILTVSDDGNYSLLSKETDDVVPGRNPMSTQMSATRLGGSLKSASVERLTLLLRHWTWADEALRRFDRELADGWTCDDELVADRPFGSYYHWCALLCGLAEAALEQDLLSPSQMDAIRDDLDASAPGLRACKQVLVVIPSSLEVQPRAADLLGDKEALGRLRRVHTAFGDALRAERMAREVESLDP